MNKKIPFLTALLAGLLLALTASAAPLATEKEEVVYGLLTPAGAVDGVYVVNSFRLDRPGQVQDYGSYAKLTNLTSLAQPEVNGDAIRWPAEAGVFSYQGELAGAELPWLFHITYTLNNQVINYRDLAGKSGHLEIAMAISQNPACPPLFFENYALQITFTLPGDRCSDIVSADATIASVGQDKTASFIVFSNRESVLSLSAQVEDFAMDGVQIAGVPLNFNVDDVDSGRFTEDISELTDAIDKIDDGAYKLYDGAKELRDGVDELKDGVDELDEGGLELKDKLPDLDEGTADLVDGVKKLAEGSQEFQDELSKGMLGGVNSARQELETASAAFFGAYAGAAVELYGVCLNFGAMDPSGTTTAAAFQLSLGYLLYSLSQEWPDAAYFNAETQAGFLQAQPGPPPAELLVTLEAESYPPLLAAYQSYASAQEGLATAAGRRGAGAVLDELNKGYKELNEGVQELYDNISEYTDGVIELSDGMKEFADGVSELAEKLPELVDGVADLTEGARKLSKGTGEMQEETANMDEQIDEQLREVLEEYGGRDFAPISFVHEDNRVSSVQFVLLTQAIQVEDEEEAAPEEEAPPSKIQSVIDNFVRLFRYWDMGRQWLERLISHIQSWFM